ncbi:hypothetical protein GOODEAATRI_023373, partial [Goodea atripinnis]
SCKMLKLIAGLGRSSSDIPSIVSNRRAFPLLIFLRLCSKPAQKKKYGLLSNYDDSVEMDAVESDEDDTLYEARSLRRSEVNT